MLEKKAPSRAARKNKRVPATKEEVRAPAKAGSKRKAATTKPEIAAKRAPRTKVKV